MDRQGRTDYHIHVAAEELHEKAKMLSLAVRGICDWVGDGEMPDADDLRPVDALAREVLDMTSELAGTTAGMVLAPKA